MWPLYGNLATSVTQVSEAGDVRCVHLTATNAVGGPVVALSRTKCSPVWPEACVKDVSTLARQSGNLVAVSCSDSSQSVVAAAASWARRLRPTGWVRPT